MSKNQLASYFKSESNDDFLGGSGAIGDVSGRSFFDLISECKDFNDRGSIEDQLPKDEYYDIWPPSSSNRSKSGQSFQFALVEPLQDPIKSLVLKYFGQQEANKRVLPNAETVIADANGLQILIKCGSFRSVVNLTHKILSNLYRPDSAPKSIYSPYSFQIWFIRIAVLMKLKFFKEADQELAQFENFDFAEFYYESHPESYPNRKGSMVPFGLRVLAAELKQFLAKSDECVTGLTRLLDVVNRVIQNDLHKNDQNAQKVWNERRHKVQLSLANILITRKNYDKAIETLFEVADSDYCTDKCSIWSCIGKIFVQIGDIMNASSSFIKAKNYLKPDSKSDQCRNYLNLSLLKIFTGQYQEAYEFLKEAHNLLPDNPTVINNMAFCLFYSGNLKEAIAFIEKQIHNNPRKILNESLLFNLCTLYELESSRAQQKKANLLLWLNVYSGDGFNETSIQLQ